MIDLLRRLPGSALSCLALALACSMGFSAAVEAEEETLDPSLSRMYAASSEEALDALVEVMEELGLKIREVDEETGRIESRKARYKEKRFEGLSVPPPRSAYGGSKVRMESFVVYAFVSPFVEPARVHVTSRINFARYKPRMDFRRDHQPELSAWILDSLDAKLGQAGSAIPLDHEARFGLARELLEDAGMELPSCLASVPNLRRLMGTAQEPIVLDGFSPELRYPQPDERRENEGAVVVEGWVLEDGHFEPSGLTKNETDRYGQLAIVTYQYSRHQEFRPARVGFCPAPRRYRYGIDFYMVSKNPRQPLD